MRVKAVPRVKVYKLLRGQGHFSSAHRSLESKSENARMHVPPGLVMWEKTEAGTHENWG
jgi:hypothetical protein